MQSSPQSKQYQIRKLLAEGFSHSEVAEKVGTSTVYVCQVKAKFKQIKSNFVPVVLELQPPHRRESGGEGVDPIWIGQVIATVLRQLK